MPRAPARLAEQRGQDTLHRLEHDEDVCRIDGRELTKHGE